MHTIRYAEVAVIAFSETLCGVIQHQVQRSMLFTSEKIGTLQTDQFTCSFAHSSLNLAHVPSFEQKEATKNACPF